MARKCTLALEVTVNPRNEMEVLFLHEWKAWGAVLGPSSVLSD